MESAVLKTLSEVDMGAAQTFENMTILPLMAELTSPIEYITMGDALDAGCLEVTEVSEQGSVPELKVHNSGDLPVLIIDGEQLIGAKQNRTVNATILLKEHDATVIPVSCTEQGRWHQVSRLFRDDDLMCSRPVRTAKMASVSASLRESESFTSNQGAVWAEVEQLSQQAGVESPTHAESDVFRQRGREVSNYLESFPCVEHQKGIMVFVNGRAVGFDFLSSEDAYRKLHTRIVKSYALEGLIRRSDPAGGTDYVERARKFIADLAKATEDSHESVGYGMDHRFESDTAVGSALVYEDCVIHSAFFAREGETPRRHPDMADYASRMRNLLR